MQTTYVTRHKVTHKIINQWLSEHKENAHKWWRDNKKNYPNHEFLQLNAITDTDRMDFLESNNLSRESIDKRILESQHDTSGNSNLTEEETIMQKLRTLDHSSLSIESVRSFLGQKRNETIHLLERLVSLGHLTKHTQFLCPVDGCSIHEIPFTENPICKEETTECHICDTEFKLAECQTDIRFKITKK